MNLVTIGKYLHSTFKIVSKDRKCKPTYTNHNTELYFVCISYNKLNILKIMTDIVTKYDY